MAYITVNGYDLPPCKRGVTPTRITVVDAARNANGVTVGQKIGRDQYKLDGLEWAYLPAATWHAILNALSPFYVTVSFYPPDSDTKKSIVMYCGDRTAEPYKVDSNGKPLSYINCKVNLIDTGR